MHPRIQINKTLEECLCIGVLTQIGCSQLQEG